MPEGALALWVITDHPSDFPDWFVLREQWVIGKEIRHAQDVFLCASLEEARSRVPPGKVNMGRRADDDPVIVEVWI